MTGASLTSVLAAAGGGSAGYGGGGGGGGGGGDGGIFILIFLIEHPILLLLVIAVIAVLAVVGWIQSVRYRARRRERVRQVELAASEAAEDDAAFSPDTVREQAASLFRDVQGAWDAKDRTQLSQMVSKEMMVEWQRRLDDFDRKGWHNRVAVIGDPVIEYVGLVNRAEDREDRCVVRIEATLKDYVENKYGQRINHEEGASDTRSLAEYWTLCKRESDGRWMLLSIEQRAEGDHHLASEVVATPWNDIGRLRDEALVEGAVSDALPAGANAAELVSVSYSDDARAAALDLSLVDARFAPDVLEVAVRRVVSAWSEAVDGADDSLAALSTPEALLELLHPGDPSRATRLVVRSPQVLGVAIETLELEPAPPRMTVAVSAEGARYIENRDTTAVVSGSRSSVVRFTERWVLALDGDELNPWRIVDASGAAAPGKAAITG